MGFSLQAWPKRTELSGEAWYSYPATFDLKLVGPASITRSGSPSKHALSTLTTNSFCGENWSEDG